MAKQDFTKMKRFIKGRFTPFQQKEMKEHCKEFLFKGVCEDCKFFKECKDINKLYPHTVVNGKKVGYFYLSDL